MQNFERRIQRLTRAVQHKKLAALFLEPGGNFYYLTGLSLGRSERLIAAVLTTAGELHLVGPAFEKERLQECQPPAEIHTWQEDEDPFAIVREVVLAEGPHKLLAVGPSSRFFIVEKLRLTLEEDSIVDAGPFLEDLRMHKDKHELSAIRSACRKTLATMDSVLGLARDGMTERELAGAIGGGIVQFSENAAVPHGGPGERKLKQGDVIIVDTGTAVDGYTSDITRTFFFGEATEEFKKIYQIVADAQAAAIDAIRPGAACESVDAAARSVIGKAGYGEYFIHRTGHGLGLQMHEPPYLVKGNAAPLEPGMVVTVEPGIYLPGKFGVRIEDDVAVTETSHEILSAKG